MEGVGILHVRVFFFCWVEFTVDNGKILVRGVGSAGEI